MKGRGKLYLRVKLLATVSGFPQANKNHDGTTASSPIEPTARNLTTTISAPVVTAVSSFIILTRGVNAAVGEKILGKKIFVLVGLFDKVNGHSATASANVKKMIESFGEVNRWFSKKTSKFISIFCQNQLMFLSIISIHSCFEL